MITETIELPATTPGTSHALTVHRFGERGARPKIYIQAALHADEIPGMIAAVRLRELLQRAEDEGRIVGEILLVPVANPIGLGQTLLGTGIGRFHFRDGRNFNRGFPHFTEDVARRVEGRLTGDEAVNRDLIRAALRAEARILPAETTADHLKRELVQLSVDADVVLDLHCDGEAAVHLYTLTPLEDACRPLACLLGADAVLLATESGDDPFDEVSSRPWHELRGRFPAHPIPLACLSVTVELRGRRDVARDLAAADARALHDFLVLAAAVAGPAPSVPAARCVATPLAGTEPLIAPTAGIVMYRREVGERVSPGEAIADVIDPITGTVTSLVSPCAGVFFARAVPRFALAGARLGKVAGATAERSGNLLSP